MAKFDPHVGDPHVDPQTSPQHADPHGLGALIKKMIVGWSAVDIWITHAGGKFHHGLLEKSLIQGPKKNNINVFSINFLKKPVGVQPKVHVRKNIC